MKRGEDTKFDAEAFFNPIGDGKNIVAWGKGKAVFMQGDPADSLFYIQTGRVKVTTVSSEGKAAIVAILSAGDFFGEGCIAGQLLRISTVETLMKSTIMRLDKAAVVRALHAQPAFSEIFMTYLLARNIRIESDLIDHLFNSSEKRLARLLVLLTNFGKDNRPEAIAVPVNQAILAEMIGTTRARVNFFMNRFRRLGFIEYNGHIQVHRSLLGALLAGELNTNHRGAEKGSEDDGL